jgi:hypothetical protein
LRENFLILPFLCIPVMGDVLHSIIIKQETEGETAHASQAVREAWRHARSLIGMKLYFEGAAILWGFVPIYGTLRGVRDRLYWAMASNVLVFEGLTGKAGRDRCRQIYQDGFSVGIRTLLTVPGLLVCALITLWAVGGAFGDAIHAYGFWIVLVGILWITIPASGAVNTYLYLKMVKQEKAESRPVACSMSTGPRNVRQ